MSCISVQNLSKHFVRKKHKRGLLGSIASLLSTEKESKKALDRVSFSIDEGECVGYIGPNGAGKSTTVKILSGILVPTEGEVFVFGQVPWKARQEVVQHIGVVFGQRTQLLWDLPVIESFDLLRDMYQIPPEQYKKTLSNLTELIQLEKLLSVPARQLSLGQRMRADIAASLLHSPKLLFLDEPTIGLDATSKLAVRDCIRHLNRENKTTILLTTHDMDDIEALCQRVLILHEGQIFLDGTLSALRKKIAPERRLIVDLLNENDSIHDNQATFIKQEGHRVFLSFNPETTATPELIQRITACHAIRDLLIENPPIEELIAKLYRKVAV